MTQIRPVRRIVSGRRTVDGAGVSLVRVIGNRDTADFDPFLMLDAFDSTDPADYIKGFPWHPHRGIETITYLIQGDIEHGDSLGNTGRIGDGDCQWMTAGSGIIHQEMPQASPRMLGAQLWLNLPAREKMTEPLYGDIRSSDVPVVREGGRIIRVIAGHYLETRGAFEGRHIKATYLDVSLEPGNTWTFDNPTTQTLFIYIVEGEAAFDPESATRIAEKQAVLFGEGDRLYVQTTSKPIRFLLMSAPPLREPVAWGGPIVMNTREELNQAFKELDEGTFIKHRQGEKDGMQ